MTQEIFEILKKYDSQFNQIKSCNFCRIPGRNALQELNDVYMKLFNTSSKLLNGCSNCIYEGLRRLSIEYFNAVEVQSEPNDVSALLSDNKETENNNKSQMMNKNENNKPKQHRARKTSSKKAIGESGIN